MIFHRENRSGDAALLRTSHGTLLTPITSKVKAKKVHAKNNYLSIDFDHSGPGNPGPVGAEISFPFHELAAAIERSAAGCARCPTCLGVVRF